MSEHVGSSRRQVSRWSRWLVLLSISMWGIVSAFAQDAVPSPTEYQAALEAAKDYETWLDCYPQGFEYSFADGVAMMLAPVGCYDMGGDPAAFFWDTAHWQQGVPDGGRVCFDTPFWIDKTEVTQEQFDRLGGEAARSAYFIGAQRPRADISWFEARDFCVLRGVLSDADVRLPTEAMWEYAARGVENRSFPWDNDWVAENVISHRGYDLATSDVGTIPAGASWIGALDMSGNVWEWVATTYEQYPYPVDAQGVPDDEALLAVDDRSSRRGLRGGSWNNSYPDELRAAYRNWGFPDYTNLAIGFRCVRLESQ